MPQFSRIVSALRKEERSLANQLAKIRTAIASLEFGGAGIPKPAVIVTPNAARVGSKKRRGRAMSPAARKAVSQRMKKYWAARRKARKA